MSITGRELGPEEHRFGTQNQQTKEASWPDVPFGAERKRPAGGRIRESRPCQRERSRFLRRVDKGERAGQNVKASLQWLRERWSSLPHTRARVAELADALRSGRSGRKAVEVRVLSRAPISLDHPRN